MGVQGGEIERVGPVVVGVGGHGDGMGAGAAGVRVVGAVRGKGLRDVCRALGRRRRALYSEEEIAEAAGLTVERLRAVEAGEDGVTVGEVDAVAAALAVVVPLPRRGRLPGSRGAGWWLTEEQRREGVESGRLCGACYRVIGKVRGCGCDAGGDASGPRP